MFSRWAARIGFSVWTHLAGLVFFACAAQPQIQYVDVHIHYEDRQGFFKDLVETYRARQAVACLSAKVKFFEVLQKAAKKYPDVIVPFLWIDLDDPDALQQIDRAYAAGFRGLKIHSPLKNYDDPSYFPVFARAERYRMIVLLHTGISYRPKDRIPRLKGSAARMRPIYLDTLARAFPDLTLIGAHMGNPWYAEAAEVARWNPNVYFDLTGSSLIKWRNELSIFRKFLWWGPTAEAKHMPSGVPHAFEKLVFGTDQDPTEIDEMIERYNQLLEACKVPEDVRRKVFAGTMVKLLGLDKSPARSAGDR